MKLQISLAVDKGGSWGGDGRGDAPLVTFAVGRSGSVPQPRITYSFQFFFQINLFCVRLLLRSLFEGEHSISEGKGARVGVGVICERAR